MKHPTRREGGRQICDSQGHLLPRHVVHDPDACDQLKRRQPCGGEGEHVGDGEANAACRLLWEAREQGVVGVVLRKRAAVEGDDEALI